MKLKPLHWDKVIANVDHSIVGMRSMMDPSGLMMNLWNLCLDTLANQKPPEMNNKPRAKKSGLFLKLLEAILKAGNRMNAGTARGNAQGFNLSALRRLSDVKSIDGKTTLLHFVVEQVVRSETPKEEKEKEKENKKEKEYLMLGLPVLGGLTACGKLQQWREGRFVQEMKGFLEECEEELKVVRVEQTRVMELVKRTTEYYQAGASKDKGGQPLQLFLIVKDFLDMVDQACQDIYRRLQKKNVTKTVGSSPPLSPTRQAVRFTNLQLQFMSDMCRTTSSSDSEDDF
ncbi:Formin-like protein 8 [Vitis vinifera]|uniref:Formin-like protein n=1 Tax=Vitis vinifera TaxID=29760 RepID=A0A438EYD8_VITVI|nr:Formin-like protein 8 [Vitis vinifera]